MYWGEDFKNNKNAIGNYSIQEYDQIPFKITKVKCVNQHKGIFEFMGYLLEIELRVLFFGIISSCVIVVIILLSFFTYMIFVYTIYIGLYGGL